MISNASLTLITPQKNRKVDRSEPNFQVKQIVTVVANPCYYFIINRESDLFQTQSFMLYILSTEKLSIAE